MTRRVHSFPVQPEGTERLLVHGDFVTAGEVAFRPPKGPDVLIPFAGVFVGSGKVGPFAVVEGLEEEVGQDGSPVGRSFEVTAADEAHAQEVARVKAAAHGIRVGRVLWTEQTEAGQWEVVFVSLLAPEPKPSFGEALAALALDYGVPVYVLDRDARGRVGLAQPLTPATDISTVASIIVSVDR
jgi:hypothetical protein